MFLCFHVVDPRQFKPVLMSDVMGKYYQIGSDAKGSRMFLFCINIDSAANLLQVNIIVHFVRFKLFAVFFINQVTYCHVYMIRYFISHYLLIQ
jgi:hypothetical protein